MTAVLVGTRHRRAHRVRAALALTTLPTSASTRLEQAPSDAPSSRREDARPPHGAPRAAVLGGLVALAGAELALALGHVLAAQIADATLVVVLLGTACGDSAGAAAMRALALVGVTRVVSAGLPLGALGAIASESLVAGAIGLATFALAPAVGVSLRLGRPAAPIALTTAVGGLTFGLGAYLLGAPSLVSPGDPAPLIVAAIAAATLAAVVEELVFRGIVQATLQRFGGMPGVLGATALFACTYAGFHSLALVLLVALLGLLLARSAYRTGTLGAAVTGHLLFAVGVAVAWPLLLGAEPPLEPPSPATELLLGVAVSLWAVRLTQASLRQWLARSRVLALVRRHPEISVALAVAALLRVAVSVAYWPGLFFSDSWAYLDAGYRVVILPDRPIGYSVLLRLLMLPGREIGIVTVTQHVAGLATGLMVYVIALCCGVGRRWAAATTAVVLLDAWSLAVEQRLLTEAFFTLTLVVAAWLAMQRPWDLAAAAGAAALVGAAVALRPAALFAAPALLAFLAWDRRGTLAVLLATTELVLVVGGYAVGHAYATGRLAITDADGWFLYGRVAEFADCGRAAVPADTRFLCQRSGDPSRRRGAEYYIWDDSSPARRRFPHIGTPGSNDTLGRFARAVVRDQPGDYVLAVGADVLRFFEPGQQSLGRSDRAIALPGRPGEDSDDDLAVRRRLLPDYVAPARFPARPLHALAHWLHLPRALLGALVAVALAALAIGLARPRRVPHRTQILLLAGMGLGQLVGAAATSDFVLRYLLPAAPLLLLAGVIALSDLLRPARHRAVRREGSDA